jgi:hypothetical protein
LFFSGYVHTDEKRDSMNQYLRQIAEKGKKKIELNFNPLIDFKNRIFGKIRRKSGTFQMPVDSSQETSGGSRMLMRKPNRDDSSTSTTNQRDPDEVYQTPRLRSPHPYRDCQTGVAVSRHLWENDAHRPAIPAARIKSYTTL